MKKPVTDHKGNEFNSISEMCKHYGIKHCTYDKRLNRGLSQEEALTNKVYDVGTTGISITTPDGKQYSSRKELCKAYGVSEGLVSSRLNIGWSLEAALLTPKRECFDHLGNSYKNIEEMCKTWGVNINTYMMRRNRLGMSIKDSLTLPLYYEQRKCSVAQDHLGNCYEGGVKEMCKTWGITPNTYNFRRRLGWSVKEALTTPIDLKRQGVEVTDLQGNTYKSLTAYLKAKDIPKTAYYTMKREGMSSREIEACYQRKRKRK